MRRLLLLAALTASSAAFGNDLAAPSVSTTFYWQKPLDAIERRDSGSAFGLRFDRSQSGTTTLLRKPLMDLRFNERGFHSLAFRGTVLHQNQPASGSAPEVNWWLVGGVAVGAAVVIHQDNKRFKNEPAAKKTGGGTL